MATSDTERLSADNAFHSWAIFGINSKTFSVGFLAANTGYCCLMNSANGVRARFGVCRRSNDANTHTALQIANDSQGPSNSPRPKGMFWIRFVFFFKKKNRDFRQLLHIETVLEHERKRSSIPWQRFRASWPWPSLWLLSPLQVGSLCVPVLLKNAAVVKFSKTVTDNSSSRNDQRR